MMWRLTKFLMVCAMPLAVSCAPESTTDNSAGHAWQPPEAILNAKAVDPTQLFLVVEQDNEPVVMTEVGDGSGSWIADIEIPPDTDSIVVAEWYERIGEEELLLARSSQTARATAGTIGYQLRFNRYDTTSMDFDTDGLSNLSERQNNSDPFDPASPRAAPTVINVDFQFDIPDAFQSATVNSENLTMNALINTRSVALTRTDFRWLGSYETIEGSDVFVDAKLFSDSSQSLRIGTALKTLNVGAGGLVVIQASDFDYQIDDDGDGLTNLEEILNGYDPTDSDDPVSDPCVPTVFVANCFNDADDDGETDFEEGPTADADGDTIPDYLESSITDDDEDIFPRQTDPDDNDPCVPNPDSFACINQE